MKIKLENLKVSTRLAIGFAFILIMLTASTIYSVDQLRQLYGRMREITEVNNVEAKLAARMEQSITERALALRNLILLDQADEIKIEVERIDAQDRVFSEAQEKLLTMFKKEKSTTDEELKLFDKIVKQKELSMPYIKKAVEMTLAGQKEEAYRLIRFEYRPIQKELWSLLRQMKDFEENLSDVYMSESKRMYDHSIDLMLALCGVSVVFGIFAATVTARSLIKQLGGEPTTVANIAKRIANGDMTVKVDVKDGDSSSIMYAMRTMQGSIVDIVSKIRDSSDTVAVAAGQIAEGNQDLSARTEQQAASLEQTAASMTELTETVRQNAENARQANSLAASAREIAEAGRREVAAMVTTIQEVNSDSQKIADITGLIEGIAFQTNILALNAAVEAARAGEHGRGFAVVAGEVRSLAQRASSSAKEINELIGSSTEKVKQGANRAEQVSGAMGEIDQAIVRVFDVISEIAAASEEQAQGILQVNQAISQIDDVTQQNAALVEESAAAARSTQEQAKNMREQVSFFQLGSTATKRPQLAFG